MAKCSRCGKRKAKRRCPALGSELCNLCCGLLREKEIHCTSNCPFLAKHKDYQDKRTVERRETPSPEEMRAEDDILKDERMTWLVLHIEAPLHEHAKRKASFTDKDAILALEYAREKLNRGKSTLIIPGKETGPKNEAGEAILESMDKCRYEKTIILPGSVETYSAVEKIKCLDLIVSSAKSWARGNLEGRNYLEQLIEHFTKIKEYSRQKKIISAS